MYFKVRMYAQMDGQLRPQLYYRSTLSKSRPKKGSRLECIFWLCLFVTFCAALLDVSKSGVLQISYCIHCICTSPFTSAFAVSCMPTKIKLMQLLSMQWRFYGGGMGAMAPSIWACPRLPSTFNILGIKREISHGDSCLQHTYIYTSSLCSPTPHISMALKG